MRKLRLFSPGVSGTVLAACLAAAAAVGGAGAGSDPLAAEIDRWSAFLQTNPRTDENWTQIKKVTQPLITLAREAFNDGRRLLALHRLAAARTNLAAAAWVGERPADKRNDADFLDAEWKRAGNTLKADLGPLHPGDLENVKPAAVRGLAEAALLQVRAFYEASAEYGRSTEPQYGLFYLGQAQAQRDFVAFCRKLTEPSSRRAPPLRSIAGELDVLEGEILDAYRPPASIDKHSDFIAASALLKEARELNTACFWRGALFRYLQAVQRFAPLRPGAAPIEGEALTSRLKAFESRLDASEFDESIGRLFLEAGQAAAGAGLTPGIAPAWPVATDVLPRYFAALEPAKPMPPRPTPRATVTLVRWPYT
ncbi:MAG TPA: hypothetical protein VKH43_03735 [Thermoanaerobaculia bacterium]|nr:hypothetical protein [Thermoanaerobaculia bacterium]